jgi:hypothetical protein
MIKEKLSHFVIVILSLIMAALQNETIKIQKSICIYLMYTQYSPECNFTNYWANHHLVPAFTFIYLFKMILMAGSNYLKLQY